MLADISPPVGAEHRLLRASFRGSRSVNATELLVRRCRGVTDAGTLIRHNMTLLRGLLLQDNRGFVKTWSKTSKSTVMYENGRIYFENYQNCYSCVHSEPHVLYKLPKRSKLEKFEDALLCQSPLGNTLASPTDQKSSLLALTANNWLYRLSAETGKELQRVYLSSKHKFRYLGWDSSQEMFYVKSVQSKETSVAQEAGITQNTVMHLAIFHVFPLQIVGILEINKKVFGSGVTDVVLSQGVLVVSYSNKSVKLYSFEHIVQRFLTEKLTLGKQSSLLGGRTVGDAPFGIPVNIQITCCLPVLFEVSCANNSVQIGGYPWHYIYTPLQKHHKGTHHICLLRDKTLASNGIQNMNCCSIESDEIFFHPDDSGRIVHVGPDTINVLKILGELNSSLPSELVEDFSMKTLRNHNPTSHVTVTSSGRAVKKRFHQLDDDPDQETFRMVEYEDELDLLAVVVTNGEEGEGRAHIQLHDNQSGRLLRTVALVESWDEMENLKQFVASLSAAGAVGVVSIIFVSRWVEHYRDGLAWDGGLAEFNWHPVLMVSGFIFVQGIAIIVYRLPWTWQCSKLTMKFIHGGLNLIAFILAVVSTVAVFDFHNNAKIPNMYSLHSWLGLIAIILYCAQLVLGVGMYLIPATPAPWRAAFMPVHVYSGLLLFGSIIAVALMGITEKLFFSLKNPAYKDLPPEAVFVNVLGLLLVVYGALIIWIATRPSWKRPSDQILHTLHTNREGEDSSKVGPSLSQLSEGADADRYKCDDQEN